MDKKTLKKCMVLTFTALTMLTAAACGKEQSDTDNPTQTATEILEIREEIQTDTQTVTYKEETQADTQTVTYKEENSETAPSTENAAVLEMKSKFGENCIADQTFEVKLSEYEEKVYFVPFMPSGWSDEFHMQIIQNGKVLDTLSAYVPEHLRFKAFTSLDAVSFFDVNYDGETDIVLIETYGDTSFAVIYYADVYEGLEREVNFYPEAALSDHVTEQLQDLSIPEVRNFLSGGKKNGEFSSYQEAYEVAARLEKLRENGEWENTFDLIYVDQDDIPELSAGHHGYYVDLFTYQNGTLYLLMDHWGYGAMGNSGYDYAPGKNSIRNYNTDYAGLVLYTTYCKINEEHAIETVVSIRTNNFDDANGNGQPDEEELESTGKYGASYIDGIEISGETWDSYDKGEYSFIPGNMSFDELMAALQKSMS